MLDEKLKTQHRQTATQMLANTTPEACGALAEQLRQNPEFVASCLLKHFEDFRNSLLILLANAGGFDNPQLKKIMMCVQLDPREEHAIDDAYRREAKVFMPGQDVQEMLVQLMKFNHHASELLLEELGK